MRRRFLVLAVFVAFAGVATVRSLLTRPVYQATAQILIERSDPAVLNFKDVQQSEDRYDDYYETQYKLLQSRSLARRVVLNGGLLNDPEFGGPRTAERIKALAEAPEGTDPEIEGAIGTVLGRLKVQPVKNSRLVSITFESFRPDLAARLANNMAETYIQQSLDMRFKTSSEAGVWLGTQIDEQRRKVEESDLALQQLKQREGLVNIEERRSLLDQRLKELGTALNERKTERLQKEALWRQMASTANPEELPEVMRSVLVQNLRIELATLERQQAQLVERYLEQHPEVVKVRNQIQETRAKIRREAQSVIRAAENDYRASAAQEASVASALEAAKQETLELNAKAGSYDSQKRELDAAKQVLDSLLSRSKETDVAQELKSTNIRIVDRATVPGGPVRPQTRRDVTMGLLMGALVGLGLAFILEYLDNTLKTPDDVKHRLGTALLGVVPEVAVDRQNPSLLVTATGAPQVFVESYRVVRTALNYSWSDKSARVILVTSTGPGEGKTLTAVNLALTLAASGGRVILVDADMRKPQVHANLSLKRTPGFSDILVGRTKPSEAIQHMPGGHSVLAAGTTVPSPADLLTTSAVTGFISGLRRVYDWIVVDSPPVGAVAEPLILAPLADGIVLVVGAEMMPRKAVQHTVERLSDAGARILGVVLNRAQTEKHSYYYSHYYGHYYGRYGYGEVESKGPRRIAKVSRIDEKRAARS